MSSKLGTASESTGRGGSTQRSSGTAVPGCFSPRPTHSRNLSTESSTFLRETPSKGVAETPTGKQQVSSVSKEAGEKFRSTRSKSQTLDSSPPSHTRVSSTGGLSPSRGSSSAMSRGKAVRRRERALRHSSPLETLLEHQRFRCSSSVKALEGASASSPDEKTRGAATSSRGSLAGPQMGRGRFTLLESYASGKPWSVVAEPHGDICRNSSRNVSSLAVSSSGEHVAFGDRSGRVFVMQQRRLDEESGDVEGGREDPAGASTTSRARRPYEFAVGRQAYTSIIDPLNNVEVTPNIQAVCFLPQIGASTYLLTANEKLPKLYKIVRVRESPSSFSAVDCLGGNQTSSLTLNPPHGTMVNAMKQVTRYALNHEYNINSLCPQADGTQFFSADDLTVKLWCVEYPEASIETYSVKPPCDEEAQEMICSVQSFPHEPFLLFVVSISGTVRVVDTRQTIKLLHRSPLTFRSTLRENDMTYNSMLLDCTLSPCGRYVAGRDTTGVCLWDVRRPGASAGGFQGGLVSSKLAHSEEHDVVQRWEVHPHLRRELDQFFQSSAVERFHLRFLNCREICTGGFANTLHLIDILDSDGAVIDKTFTAQRYGNVKSLRLPKLQDSSDRGRGSLQVSSANSVSLPTAGEGEGLFSTAVTHLSSPLTSHNGDCSILASCGSALFQIGYPSLRL